MTEIDKFGKAILQQVVILRALPGLGDLLCAVPAFRALRAALPQAHLTLIGLPWARTFVERFKHYLDGFIEFPGYPGLPDQPPQIAHIPAFLTHVQEQQFDLALQMHGSGLITNSLTMLLGARLNAGFFLPGHYCPDEERFLAYPAHEPEVWRLLRLLEFLKIPLQGDALEFPLNESDWQALFAIPEIWQLQAEYICIHPGASTLERCWPVDRFAVVADALADQGFQVVLTGTLKEIKLTQAVARAMRSQPLDLAGQTTLGSLAALLSSARLVICNDTGVSHLAAALQTPSVVIFTQSNPHRWAPLDRKRHHIVYPFFQASSQEAATPGSEGCTASIQPSPELLLRAVTVEMVMAQVEALLQPEVAWAA